MLDPQESLDRSDPLVHKVFRARLVLIVAVLGVVVVARPIQLGKGSH